MSRYEWESGTIKIPTKVFASLRRDFISGWNKIQQTKLDNLKYWRTVALRDGKGTRNYDFKDRMLCFTDGWDEVDLVESLFDDSSRKPKMPTKKMFNFVNGKVFNFDIGECGVGFNSKEHSVGWSVFENNHACESAHAKPESKLLFRLLGNINFTRGSGGVIVGNDEYNRDDYNEGGGGNYTKITYGKQKERRSFR